MTHQVRSSRLVRPFLLLLPALALFAASAAHADPLMPHFSSLLTELKTRLSGDPLSHRQAHAVRRALARLHKPADSLAADIDTARRLARGLATAFPDEFRDGTGLAAQLETAVSGLSDDVSSRLQYGTEAVRYIAPGRCADRMKAAIADASNHPGSASEATRLVRRAKQLGVADDGGVAV